jgi:hypothetical protein
MKKLKKLIFNLTSVTIVTGFIFIVSATSAFAYYYQYGYSLYSYLIKSKMVQVPGILERLLNIGAMQ